MPSRAAAFAFVSGSRVDDDGRDMFSRGCVTSPSGRRFTAVDGRLLDKAEVNEAEDEDDVTTERVSVAVEGRGGRIVPAPRHTVGIVQM